MSLDAMKQALALICSARLCEINSMSSRQEMLRLMIEATDTLRAAIEQADKPRQWQGLTKREFLAAVDGLEDLEDCWVAIEAKLKEKNT